MAIRNGCFEKDTMPLMARPFFQPGCFSRRWCLVIPAWDKVKVEDQWNLASLYKSDVVETLLADPNEHHTPLRSNVLWQLGLLEMWLQQNGIS